MTSKNELKVNSGAALAVPIYVESAGKVLLSELKEKEIRSIINKIELSRVGPNAMTDKVSLITELIKIKKQGYSKTFGEVIHGAASDSIRIRGYFNRPHCLS